MELRFVVFFLVMGSIWAAAHLYVGWRMIRPLGWPPARRRRAWIAVWVLWLLAPATMILGRPLHGVWMDVLSWVSFVYMGLFSLIFAFTAFRDLLAVGPLLVQRWRTRRGHADLPDPERRRFLTNATNAGVLGVSGALSSWGFAEAVRLPEVKEVDVPVEGLPPELDGYRIAQITDVHVGPTIRGDYVKQVVDRVNGLSADLVAVTGDLVDGYVNELAKDVAPLGDLTAPDGVYFVTGNHEYYWGPAEWTAELERLGLVVLSNAHRLVQRAGAAMLVAGVTDYNAAQHVPEEASDPAKALDGAPDVDFRLLLAHQPKSIHAAVRAGFDLQISGHTHGGQFFPWTLFVGLAHPFTEGLGRLERTWIYVSRGTGYWGPPLRAGAPSEITLLRLRSA